MLMSHIGRALGAALLSATLALSTQAHAQGKPDSKDLAIQIYPGSLASLLATIADKQGFYKQNGLNVRLLNLGDGPRGLAAIEGGSIQLASNNSDFVFLARNRGLDISIVLGNWGQQFTVMARRDLPLPNAAQGFPAVMKDLQGKRLGVTARGSGTEYAMRAILTSAGLDPEKEQFVAVGGTASQVPALRGGNVDTVVAAGMAAAVLEASGVGVPVVDLQRGKGPAELLQLSACYETYYGKRDWITQNEDTVRRFQAAHRAAETWAREPANSDKLAAIAMELMPVADIADAPTVVKGYLQHAQYQTRYDRDCAKGWNELLLKNNLIEKPVDLDAAIWSGLTKP